MLLNPANRDDYNIIAAIRGPDVDSDGESAHILKAMLTTPIRLFVGVEYAWGAPQAESFWSNLTSLQKDRAIELLYSPKMSHYAGHIVFAYASLLVHEGVNHDKVDNYVTFLRSVGLLKQ